MALLTRCDRCHDEVPDTAGKVVRMFDLRSPNAHAFGGTELCNRCVKQLEQWLAPIPHDASAN